MKSKTGQNVAILLSTLTILLFVLSPPAGARPVKVWSFQELTKQADLVIVATARSSADTKNFVHPDGY